VHGPGSVRRYGALELTGDGWRVLGFDSWMLSNSNEGRKENLVRNGKWHGKECKQWIIHHPLGCPCGSIYKGG
jgi:hypothetical protein